MAKSESDGRSVSELQDRLIKNNPRFREAWDESSQRRKIAHMLIKARLEAGLSQQEVAKRAHWSKSYVSRVESIEGPFPSLVTIARYIEACGESIALFVGGRTNDHVVVRDVVDLKARDDVHVFETVRADNLEFAVPR